MKKLAFLSLLALSILPGRSFSAVAVNELNCSGEEVNVDILYQRVLNTSPTLELLVLKSGQSSKDFSLKSARVKERTSSDPESAGRFLEIHGQYQPEPSLPTETIDVIIRLDGSPLTEANGFLDNPPFRSKLKCQFDFDQN